MVAGVLYTPTKGKSAIRRDGWMDLRRGGGCSGGETLEESGAEGLGGGARVG